MKILAIALLCIALVVVIVAVLLALAAWNDINAILDGMRDDPWMIK